MIALSLTLMTRRAHAQTTCDVPLILTQLDSLHAETLRRNANGVLLSPRTTVVRRLTDRARALVRLCVKDSPVTVDVSFTHTTTTLWERGPRGIGTFPRGDSAVVCAAVQIDSVAHIATPYVVVKYVSNDSITWRTVPQDDLIALRTACNEHWQRWPEYGSIRNAPLALVRWRLLRVHPFTIAYPFAEPVLREP